MIYRELTSKLKDMANKMPVVAILGPRQSGKTTLAHETFPEYTYLLFENLDLQEFAKSDPKGFLKEYSNEKGLILDEIQNVPELFSYLQGVVDENRRPGYFILTGSQNFLLNEKISQSLAGRFFILTLLPFSIRELEKANRLPGKLKEFIFKGSYPPIYAYDLKPHEWYPDYIRTYLEKDVRQLKNIADLSTFQKFIKLCAGRTGQLLNIASLANDTGITSNTAKSWLSVLESSYIIFLLQPHFKNFSKRLIKSPKLYFYDTGLAASLLEIKSAEQLYSHYLRGGLFESLIISELYKNRFNHALLPHYYFWRDKVGNEVDVLFEEANKLIPVEIKSGSTINPDFFKGLETWNRISGTGPDNNFIIYAGDTGQKRLGGRVLSWKRTDTIFDYFEALE